jgi:hypothetical protein
MRSSSAAFQTSEIPIVRPLFIVTTSFSQATEFYDASPITGANFGRPTQVSLEASYAYICSMTGCSCLSSANLVEFHYIEAITPFSTIPNLCLPGFLRGWSSDCINHVMLLPIALVTPLFQCHDSFPGIWVQCKRSCNHTAQSKRFDKSDSESYLRNTLKRKADNT